MVRTAILAGILLVLLAIAADRPGTLPQLPRLAVVTSPSPAPVEALSEMPPQPVRKPTVAAKPAVVEEAPVVEEAAEEDVAEAAPTPAPEAPKEVAVVPAPAPAVPFPPATTVAAATPVAPPLPVAQPGAPLRLLPPVMEPSAPQTPIAPPAPVAQAPVATPQPLAEVEDVAVATRPLFKPANELPRGTNVAQMPELPAPPAQIPQNVAQVQPGEGVKFMTREERSRELYRLAREMENTFMDKLAR